MLAIDDRISRLGRSLPTIVGTSEVNIVCEYAISVSV
jgi:hypothetical protein